MAKFGFKKEDSVLFIFTAIFSVLIYWVNAPTSSDIIPVAQVFEAIFSGLVVALIPWGIAKLIVGSRRKANPPTS